MATRLVGFMALALTAVMLTGCSSSHEPSKGGEPSDPVTIVLTVYRAEWEADKILMGVGDGAMLQSVPMTTMGCPTVAPCPLFTDLTLCSSDTTVVSIQESLVLRPPARAYLYAHAPGTATVSVTADGHTEFRQVTVVTGPPPLDSLQVAVVTEWKDLPAQYDPSHNLTWVEVPGGDYYPFAVRGFRGGKEIFGHPISVSRDAINPMILDQPAIGCRPTRADIHCEVIHDFWLRGINPGDDQVTVYGRGASAHFTVHVPCEGLSLDCPVPQTSVLMYPAKR